LAADKGLKSWVEEIPISEKGLTEAGKPFSSLSATNTSQKYFQVFM
jgi:hypothetical protein